MKLSTLLLLTLIILASILQVIHAECVFQCNSTACGQYDSRLYDEETSPGLVYTAEVDSGSITSTCSDKGCRESFDINNENVTYNGEIPDMDEDPSGKTEKELGLIEFSCTTANGSTETLTLLVSAFNTNDNEATFVGETEYETTIPELAKPGVVLGFGEIKLIDRDRLQEHLTYELITEDEVPFEVNGLDQSFNADGIITFKVIVKNPPAVDFERVRKYNLTLAVTDAQEGNFKDHVSSVTLMITVEDLDDKDPVFDHLNYAATIEEGTVGDLTVTPEDIHAYDQDLDLNVNVVFSITSIHNSKTGPNFIELSSGDEGAGNYN